MNKFIVQRILHLKQLIIMSFNLMIIWQSSCVESQGRASGDKLLPPTEVSSINTMIYQFKTKNIAPIVRGHCQNSVNNYGYSINCNCGGQECHISEIRISGYGLSGTIDAGIADLSGLTVINLSANKLHGPIPDSLGNLPKLITLDLSNNQLSGTIPNSLGNLESLQYLYLHKNFLEGAMPASLGNLSNLQQMYMDFNKLSGSLPTELGKLENLQYLGLAENRFTGEIPDLGNLLQLKGFWMLSNLFSGPLPNLENLIQLQQFGVAGNKLTGPLPPYITKWTGLQSLELLGNNFEGPIHHEYFNMRSLVNIFISDLDANTGLKLPEKADLPSIYSLVLRRCSLSGPIPGFIGELSTLKHLDLSFNMFTGRIPESMRPNLLYLSLARNNLNGTIPDWIFQASKTRMDISYNNFSTMDIPIPSNLDLNIFACCCCEVSSTTEPYMLQPTVMAVEYSRDKPAFHNLFINSGGNKTNSNGTTYDNDNMILPFYTSPLQNWAYSFSGDFLVVTPNSSDFTKRVACTSSDSETSLYDDARLSPVSLQYYGFRLQKGLYNVTLHFSEIVYIDDGDYDILRKRVFDIYVQGGTVMKDFVITDRAGTPNKATTVVVHNVDINETYPMLDIHLYWAGKGSFTETPAFNGPLIAAISVNPLFKVGQNKTIAAWKIALIALSSLVVALLLLLTLAWFLGWFDNKELENMVKVGESYQSKKSDKDDTLVKVKKLIDATGKFSDDKKIGSGQLGAVYKADNEKDPKFTVAVKKIFPRHKEKIGKLIKKEIYVPELLEDGNLIKLLGFHMGDKLQLLIYEYAENESLETALFNSIGGTLSWEKRFNICHGIAMGLASLHRHRIKIVHGNLKCSNILLDKDYNPKLSDFGYAGIYNDDDKLSVSKQGASRGHLAPEYYEGDDVSMKTDIYSFGVILLEIVAGHGNKERKGDGETTDLVDKVHYHFRAKIPSVSEFIDKKLADDFNTEQVERVLRLAELCTSSPSLRPWITDILSVLNDDKTVDDIFPIESSDPPKNGVKTTSATDYSKALALPSSSIITEIKEGTAMI